MSFFLNFLNFRNSVIISFGLLVICIGKGECLQRVGGLHETRPFFGPPPPRPKSSVGVGPSPPPLPCGPSVSTGCLCTCRNLQARPGSPLSIARHFAPYLNPDRRPQPPSKGKPWFYQTGLARATPSLNVKSALAWGCLDLRPAGDSTN